MLKSKIIRGANGINYAVVRERPGECDEELWSETILFGRDKAYRTGGSAFHFAGMRMDNKYCELCELEGQKDMPNKPYLVTQTLRYHVEAPDKDEAEDKVVNEEVRCYDSEIFVEEAE